MTARSAQELLEDRLLRCDSKHADLLLQVVVEDSLDYNRLTYENMVQPLKTTGGRLALQVTFPDEQRTFVRYTPPGYLEASEPDTDGPATTIAPHDVKRWLYQPGYDLTVVPIEHSAFLGGGDT